jgi:hypothetical protein
MIAMRMVQPPIDQIVNVVAMWNRLMAAAWAMPMVRFMSSGTVLWRAAIRIYRSYFNYVFVNMSLTNMMQVTVFDIINVVLVANRRMTTGGSVDVRMIGDGHADLLSSVVQRSIDPFLAQAFDRPHLSHVRCRQMQAVLKVYVRSASRVLDKAFGRAMIRVSSGTKTRDVELPAGSENKQNQPRRRMAGKGHPTAAARVFAAGVRLA